MSLTYLEVDEAAEIHEQMLDLHGGQRGFNGPDGPGLLESALFRPRMKAHYQDADLVAQAAALMFGIAKNHAFLDGNKRLALAATDAFLQLNGFELDCPNDLLYEFIARCSEPDWTEPAVETFLRPRVVPLGQAKPRAE